MPLPSQRGWDGALRINTILQRLTQLERNSLKSIWWGGVAANFLGKVFGSFLQNVAVSMNWW